MPRTAPTRAACAGALAVALCLAAPATGAGTGYPKGTGIGVGWTAGPHLPRIHSSLTASRPPLLLLIPGGGFVRFYDTTTAVGPVARRHGFALRTVRYTLGDPLTAWRETRALARRASRRGREVYAYGESAGGTLAALLAVKGIVDAAAANAPPSNLVTWSPPGNPSYWGSMRNHGTGTRRALSPVFQRSRSPILVQQSPADSVVPARMNEIWAKRDRLVRLARYPGYHLVGKDLSAYADNLRGAFDFLGVQRAVARR